MAQDADIDQQPLKGVVLCCTSLAQDVRTKLAEVASQMGAVHKLDLTADVTHLLVGNINTPKYKYVAKERPDIRVLSPEFVEAVREAWKEGGEVDVESLEKKHTIPPFFGLQLCLTGVEDLTERKEMESTIISNGGVYNGDLTRQVTHLLVAKPTGAKYIHAKQWGINVVSLKWYKDCLVRGLAVDESCYLPEMPLDQQGVGAFRTVPKRMSLGKRGRDDEQTATSNEAGRKKLRKTASMRINAQSQDYWQTFSPANELQVDNTTLDAWNDESQTMTDLVSIPSISDASVNPQAPSKPLNKPEGLFGGHAVLIHGFDDSRATKLREFLEPNGATVATSALDLQTASQAESCLYSCLIVPHNQPVSLPAIPEGTLLVTEWWVERCLHMKQRLDPAEDLLSTPLFDRMVDGFQNLNISTTGFTGVDLRQMAQSVERLGAKYQEVLLPSTSVLVCATETVKSEKAFYATKHNIPVVSADWFWQSLKTQIKASIDDFLLKLPALHSSERIRNASPSSLPLENSRVPPFRRSADDQKRADELAPKRLSNTRRRHATPALSLKASRPGSPKSSKTTHCPFVLEDDDEEDVGDLPNEQQVPSPAPDSRSQPLPPNVTQPLRELSPNASQSSSHSGSQARKPATYQAFKESARETHAAPLSPQRSPRPSPEKENRHSPSAKRHLTSELAGLLNRQIDSDKITHPAEEKKRKNRPLGRNLSVISHRSNSASGSPAILEEEGEYISLADGFAAPHEVPNFPPSTQLGYENPEAEAHRREMSKKMGFVLHEDVGTRVTIGTVKDSREVAARSAKGAVGSRSKTRSRQKT